MPAAAPGRKATFVPEPVIDRDEVVGLLFNVSDISVTLTRIEELLRGGDEEEEADES